ncbi:hypothetical protein ACJIZ3_008676 [Penstemon smallii]|uniref:Uncharacterized protein n=1 Tax=Penstemon smallii TaxID=265156 RepID=A0ABD3TB64_9LAMI
MEVSTSIRFSFVTTINITIPKFTKTRYQTTKIRCIGWYIWGPYVLPLSNK